MKNIVVLGSTGSIGVSSLDVIKKLGRDYRVLGIAANSSVELFAAQIKRHAPKWVTLSSPDAAAALLPRLGKKTALLSPGVESMMEMAAHSETDLVINGLVGGVGFGPLVAAIKAGKTIALANKEPMVMAGQAIMSECRRWNARILPVDSEPSAIFQSLEGDKTDLAKAAEKIHQVLLTASGGPFFRHKGSLDNVKPAQALAHPRWKMGRKITVDSATLMNKGFEAIEIMNMFGLPLEKVKIVVHPQSLLHSAVEYEDGAVLAEISLPDMRLPIQYAITYPERKPSPVPHMSIADMRSLEFYEPDFSRFPCLELALSAAKAGGTYPAVLSAADEIAVEAFLAGAIKFTDIPRLVYAVLNAHSGTSRPPSLAEAVEMDQWGRERAAALVGKKLPLAKAFKPKRKK